MPINIGVDLDGTVADNLPLLTETLNAHCGKELRCEDITQYDLCGLYGLSEAEFYSLMGTKEQEIISRCTLIPQAREYLEFLVRDGYEVHIITARHPGYKQITERWLKEKGVPYSGLHLLNSHDKLDTCRDLGISLMVEDNVHNAIQLEQGGVRTILYTAPHNRDWPWNGLRCLTWQDIYLTLLRISGRVLPS